MGAYSPPAWLDRSTEEWIHHHVTQATVDAMLEEGRPYRGVLYPGLMVPDKGPQVLEYNCRFGDPETQVLLPRLKTDLLEVLRAAVNNRLEGTVVEWSEEACVGVVPFRRLSRLLRHRLPHRGLDDVDRTCRSSRRSAATTARW
jgi:phosphoribosylamine--glycine ligase